MPGAGKVSVRMTGIRGAKCLAEDRRWESEELWNREQEGELRGRTNTADGEKRKTQKGKQWKHKNYSRERDGSGTLPTGV